MMALTGDNANDLYAAACHAVLRHGHPVQPRGMATVEVLGAHLCLTDPRRRYVDLPPARILNPAFAVAEAVWILSGSDDPWIFTYNRSLARYADGGRLRGAYGPRLRRWRGHHDQLAHVGRLLTRDPQSRQAVVQLFDPERDSVGHRDVPCTLGYRFFVRDGRLHMHTTMRSNDLWLGFPYDLFTATVLQELLAGWLGVGLGEYHHHVDSLHLYIQHLDYAERIPPVADPSPAMRPVTADWDRFTDLLAEVVAGRTPADMCAMWTVFARVMESYRVWSGGDRDRARVLAAGIDDDLGRALGRWYDHLTTPVPAGDAAAVR